MTAPTQISQAAKDAAAEIDGDWNYASKCEVIQTAMNHAVGEIREQLDQAMEHQELPYHTCAGKDCKNSHCQLRQERDRLVDQVEQLKKELTLKQDGNPEWLLARNQDLRQALMSICQELNIPWGDYDKAKDAVINLCAQVEQLEPTIKFLLGESRTLRAQNAELKEKNVVWALGVEQSNTDIVDMQRDEFRRIIALTNDQPEIKGICERAIACIEQTVPVVLQRDQLQKQNAELQRDKSCLLAVVRMSYLNTVNDKNLTPQEQKRLGAALFTWGCSNEAKTAYGDMQKEGK